MAEKNSKGIFDLSSVYDRVVAGNLPVTPTFTPENLNRNTVLQIQGKNALDGNNKTFLDSSGNGLALTPTGTPTQGSFSPFSPAGWGGYFSATGNYVYTANSAFNVGSATAVWTFEYWVNPQTNGVHLCIGNGGGYGNSFWVGYNASTLKFGVGQGTGGANPIEFATTSTYPLNNWYHVAVTRTSAGVVTIYVNGVAAGTQTYASAVNSGTTFVINGLYDSNGIGNSGGTFSAYNVRFVMGSLVYTKTFVPPTAPLTAIPGTVLLALQDNRFKDNSVNNNTFTVGGTPRVVPFSPFSQTAEYNKNVHGGSGYFNGSTDYLTLSDGSSSIDISSGDFTVEMWVYATTTTNGPDSVFGYGSYGTMLYHSGTSWTLEVGNGGGNYFSLSGTASLNAWHHFAFTRSGTSFTLYIDGVAASTNTTAGALASGRPLYIGNNSGGSQKFTGYISNFRIVKGTALYTAKFIPPTAPLTPVTNTSLLVKFDNAAIVDSTTKNNLITVGDTKLSTTATKFNKSSMYFDGTGDYLVIPSSANYGYGTGDFTIEFWLYLNSVGTQTIISSLTSTSSVNPHLYYQTGQGLKYFTNSADRIAGSALAINTWYYIALCRAAGSTKLFINGVQTGSTYTDANNYGTSAPLVVGTYYSSGTTLEATSGLNGYIDDLRITKGIARYTSTFTPTPLEKDKTLALEVLIVAGGGGGGPWRNPGGGAGGLLYYGNNTTTKTPNGPPIIAYSGVSCAVAVGAGGNNTGSNLGGSSSFGSYTAIGGAGGNNSFTTTGGSAGGVGTKYWTPGQGNGGGGTTGNGKGGGGGAGTSGFSGGAYSAVTSGTNIGGAGGSGLQYPEFTGILTGGDATGYPNGLLTGGWFAGGGGGGGHGEPEGEGGRGGNGGGGAAGISTYTTDNRRGKAGLQYSGGGGGGTSDLHNVNGGTIGGEGGSGVVIVSYAGTTALATGGTISTTVRPGYVCHTFTGVGTFAVI